ncbi:hypothetical protein [Massilioclostridium coli]|uniref:hypothetical protein n=1 Tax=Massilioclostridium coli TaxID=1870991 RepID=UPI00114D3164|nr:hypothetical protein [Massilioclostridium coli]
MRVHIRPPTIPEAPSNIAARYHPIWLLSPVGGLEGTLGSDSDGSVGWDGSVWLSPVKVFTQVTESEVT